MCLHLSVTSNPLLAGSAAVRHVDLRRRTWQGPGGRPKRDWRLQQRLAKERAEHAADAALGAGASVAGSAKAAKVGPGACQRHGGECDPPSPTLFFVLFLPLSLGMLVLLVYKLVLGFDRTSV